MRYLDVTYAHILWPRSRRLSDPYLSLRVLQTSQSEKEKGFKEKGTKLAGWLCVSCERLPISLEQCRIFDKGGAQERVCLWMGTERQSGCATCAL